MLLAAALTLHLLPSEDELFFSELVLIIAVGYTHDRVEEEHVREEALVGLDAAFKPLGRLGLEPSVRGPPRVSVLDLIPVVRTSTTIDGRQLAMITCVSDCKRIPQL